MIIKKPSNTTAIITMETMKEDRILLNYDIPGLCVEISLSPLGGLVITPYGHCESIDVKSIHSDSGPGHYTSMMEGIVIR